MKCVFVGATRGMGRALARRLVERGDSVFLLGRDRVELEKTAADLRARDPRSNAVGYSICDFEQPSTFDEALAEADRALGGLDSAIVTAGIYATQDALDQDPSLLSRMLQVNFASTVRFCEKVKVMLLKRGRGTICVFSSVAGDRGRKPAGIYGATKAAISHYLESLDHRYHDHGLRVVCVKPGFVRTGMTEGLKAPPFAGEPDEVADIVLEAIDRGTPVVYAPRMWWLVMQVIQRLPRFIMRKIGF